VLGFPIYVGSPGTVIVRYVDRAGNLHGINTVIIALGSLDMGKSVDTMTQKVQTANDTVQESITLYSKSTLFGMAPGEGDGSPADITRQAGTQIRP